MARFNRSRKQLQAIADKHFDMSRPGVSERHIDHKPRSMLLWHFNGLVCERDPLLQALEEADFEVRDCDIYFEVTVCLDKKGKEIQAEQAAEAKRKEDLERELEEDRRAEQLFEMRAAFGPGVEVVNIITGERTIT